MVMRTAPLRGHRPTLEGPGFLARADLQVLIDLLREDGRIVIGPTVQDGAIVFDEITSIEELPRGVGDEQGPGRYRLRRRGDEQVFGYVVGPTAWKKWTFPAFVPLTRATKDGHQVQFTPEPADARPVAFLGARACDLAALGVQDAVFTGTAFVDPDYLARRARVLVVAVQCTTAASTCFCTSMGTGPEVESGYDVLLCPVSVGPTIPHCPQGTPVQVDEQSVTYWMGGLAYTTPFSVTGNPVAVLPVSRSTEGLPIGIQVIGRRWDDMRVLAVAEAIDSLHAPHRLSQPMPKQP